MSGLKILTEQEIMAVIHRQEIESGRHEDEYFDDHPDDSDDEWWAVNALLQAQALLTAKQIVEILRSNTWYPGIDTEVCLSLEDWQELKKLAGGKP